MLKHVTAHDRIKLSAQFLKVVQRHSPKSMSVSGKQLSRYLQKFFGYINSEIVQIKPSFADHFKHDAITTANVEHG